MSERKLAGIDVALVIAADQFRDEELFTPKARLESEGARTVVASKSLSVAKGMLGGSATPDVLIKDLAAMKPDAIIVVGGMGSPEHLWHDTDLHELLRRAAEEGKVVASICLSGAVLANAGVLQGKKATVWEMPESVKALADGGATLVSEPVVRDGRVITANGPEAAGDFAEAIIDELCGVKSGVNK